MGLFSDNDDNSSSDNVCPIHDLTVRPPKTLVGGMYFKEFSECLAGACTAIVLVVSLYHLFNHATHLSLPRQQVKVMRVVALVPLYCIVSLLCICFPTAAVYIIPILDLLQALCLASYFMLLCEYLSPHNDGRDAFFRAIEIEDKSAPEGKVGDNVAWFWQRTFMIFQYPVVAFCIAIATIATQAAGVYCQFESKTNFAKLWLSIAGTISPGLAFAAIILVAVNIKKHKPELKPITKLVAIKLVVGLAFIQQIIFWILESTGALNPTDTLTFADLHIGIKSLLSCLEMMPISFLVMWAYPVAPYLLENISEKREERGETHDYVPTSYQGGIGGIRAFTSMVNPLDVIKAIIAAFSVALKERASRYNSGESFSPAKYLNQFTGNSNGNQNSNYPQHPPSSYGQGRSQGPPGYDAGSYGQQRQG